MGSWVSSSLKVYILQSFLSISSSLKLSTSAVSKIPPSSSITSTSSKISLPVPSASSSSSSPLKSSSASSSSSPLKKSSVAIMKAQSSSESKTTVIKKSSTSTISTTSLSSHSSSITKTESPKVILIQKVLDDYFPNPPVPLNSNCPFTFLCAVILSAQTTDGKVNEVTKVLWEQGFGDPYKLKDHPVDKVQAIIQPVGLAPAKAKYLVGTAKMICEEYNGVIPGSLEELIKLPGVGKKTASVVLSQVFAHDAFAVDTHVHRLANRWGLSKHTDVNKVQEDLMSTFEQEYWNKLHLQMIYFGRQYCTAKDHTNSECPICSWVHKANVVELPNSNEVFTPKKKSKGIVFYEDRIIELQTTPSLSYCSSPTSPQHISTENDKKRKVMKLDIDEDVIVKETNKRKKK